MEFLVVLMIVCACAGIASLGTKWADDIGEKTSDQQQAAALGMLVNQYKLHMGTYPAKLDDLTVTNSAGYGPYTNKIPKDSYERNFNFQSSALGFAIWSNGANGVNDSGTGINGLSGDDAGTIGY